MIIAFYPLNEKAHSPGVGWPCDDAFFVQTNATLPAWSEAPKPVTKVCKRVGVGSEHRSASILQPQKSCKASVGVGTGLGNWDSDSGHGARDSGLGTRNLPSRTPTANTRIPEFEPGPRKLPTSGLGPDSPAPVFRLVFRTRRRGGSRTARKPGERS